MRRRANRASLFDLFNLTVARTDTEGVHCKTQDRVFKFCATGELNLRIDDIVDDVILVERTWWISIHCRQHRIEAARLLI
ncbi:MAG: hypothetical protein ACI9BW_000627 [Gammaproteobacteria bacterium]|jgi:hypothetical protein